jgi:hypothetical protein
VREDELTIAPGTGARLRFGGAYLALEASDLRLQRLDRRFAFAGGGLQRRELDAEFSCFSGATVGINKTSFQAFDVGVRYRQLLLQENYFFIHCHHLPLAISNQLRPL